MMEVVVTAGAKGCAKLQSNHYHQQTNTKSFFTGRMPFRSPNQQCQSTEGKICSTWHGEFLLLIDQLLHALGGWLKCLSNCM